MKFIFPSALVLLLVLAVASCKKDVTKSTGHLTVKVAIAPNASISATDTVYVTISDYAGGNVIFEKDIPNNHTADFGEVNPGTYYLDVESHFYSCHCQQAFQIVANHDKEIDVTQ